MYKKIFVIDLYLNVVIHLNMIIQNHLIKKNVYLIICIFLKFYETHIRENYREIVLNR